MLCSDRNEVLHIAVQETASNPVRSSTVPYYPIQSRAAESSAAQYNTNTELDKTVLHIALVQRSTRLCNSVLCEVIWLDVAWYWLVWWWVGESGVKWCEVEWCARGEI